MSASVRLGSVEELRRALAEAPEPLSHAAVRGRATAGDYLATLERMLGMDPADQEAARFWLAHSRSLPEAQQAARRLLAHLPDHVAEALSSLAKHLDDDLVVTSFPYLAKSDKVPGKEFEEQAVLLSRSRWLSNGKALLGIGFGQRINMNPDNPDESPFWGIYADDPDVFRRIRESWKLNNNPWDRWVWWKHLDLTPPTDRSDLLIHFAREAARLIHLSWEQDIHGLDEGFDSPAA